MSRESRGALQPGQDGCRPRGCFSGHGDSAAAALIAPRALLLQTGDTDYGSDPKGEFLAAIAARPVFELFGKRGPATDAFPPAGQYVGETLAYYMHAGGHGRVPGDWAVFLDFLERQLGATRSAR